MMAVFIAQSATTRTDAFTSSSTWTAPGQVTDATVRCWGGGGAGGNATGNPACGGGGAGGSFAVLNNFYVQPGTVYTVTVGAATTTNTGTGVINGNDSQIPAVFGSGTNLISDNDSGFETSVSANWTNGGNVTSMVQSAAQAHTGADSMLVTDSAATTDTVPQINVTGITAGTSYDFSIWVYSPNASNQFRININWKQSGGTFISNAVSSTASPGAATWTQMTVTAVAPALATNCDLSPLQLAATVGAGETYHVDDVFCAAAGTSLVLAKGGPGGSGATTNSSNGAGGTGSTTGCIGDTLFAGGNGATGAFATPISGGGGGGAGTTGAGGNASGGTAGTGTANNGGGGGAGVAATTAGATGTAAGGGGSGGDAATATDKAGGIGAAGRVEFVYTIPQTIILYRGEDYAIRYRKFARGNVFIPPPAVSATTPVSDGDTGTGVDAEVQVDRANPVPSIVLGQQLNTALWYRKFAAKGRTVTVAQPITVTDTDVGSGLDAGESITATLSDSDTGTGVDTEAVAFNLVTQSLLALQALNSALWYRKNASKGRISIAQGVQAPTPVSDGDVGTGLDAGESITATLSDSDTGTGVDTESLSILATTPALYLRQANNAALWYRKNAAKGRTVTVAQPITVTDGDTGVGVDAGESITATLSDADTGIGVDTESVSFLATTPALYLWQAGATAVWYRKNASKGRTNFVPYALKSVSDGDTGVGLDAGESIAVTLSDSDTGTGLDTESLSILATTPALYLRQAVNAALWRYENASKGRVTLKFTAVTAVSDGDTGVGVDAGESITATLSDADTGTGLDTESLAILATTPALYLRQANNAALWYRKNARGSVSFVAGSPVVQISDGDTGSSVETASITATLSGTETGSGLDAGSIVASLTGADTSGSAEAVSLTVTTSGADSGSGADTGTVFTGTSVVDGDTVRGVDNFYPPNVVPTPPQHGAIWPPPVTRRPFGRK